MRGSTYTRVNRFAAALGLIAVGCSATVDGVSETAERVVYGADDRKEYFELRDAHARSTISESAAGTSVRRTSPPGTPAKTRGSPNGSVREYSPTSPPPHSAPAYCRLGLQVWRGTLRSPVLVENTAVIFDYYYDGPGTRAFTPGDVAGVAEIVAERSTPKEEPRLDYAWLRSMLGVAPPRADRRPFTSNDLLPQRRFHRRHRSRRSADRPMPAAKSETARTVVGLMPTDTSGGSPEAAPSAKSSRCWACFRGADQISSIGATVVARRFTRPKNLRTSNSPSRFAPWRGFAASGPTRAPSAADNVRSLAGLCRERKTPGVARWLVQAGRAVVSDHSRSVR
jgi:hypothetical protein